MEMKMETCHGQNLSNYAQVLASSMKKQKYIKSKTTKLKYNSSDTQPDPQTERKSSYPYPCPILVFIQEPHAGCGLLYSLTPPPQSDIRMRVGAKVALPYGGTEFVLCLYEGRTHTDETYLIKDFT